MSMSITSLRNGLAKNIARARARGISEMAGAVTGSWRAAVHSEGELTFLTRTAAWEGRVKRSDEPMALQRASFADAADYAHFIGTDAARTFAARLSDTASCWLVRARGTVVHATWTTRGVAWTSEIRRFFVAPQGSAYIYESFTRPEARGLGVYPFALVGIGHALATEGVDTLFVGVEADNHPSVRAITKAGFEPAFSLRFRRRWGRAELSPATGPLPELAEICLRPAPPREGVAV